MASAINPITASTTTNNTSTSGASLGSSAPTEQMFLQLLVAQIQNQDPLNPTDSTQFVSQLAQFSQLEQVMAIRTDIESGQAAAAAIAQQPPAQQTNNISHTTAQSNNNTGQITATGQTQA